MPNIAEPIRIIEWVVAICTFLGGLYLFSPLYAYSQYINGTSAVIATLTHPALIALWAVILLFGAAFVIIGLSWNKPQIKSVGWFTMILARFFQILSIWLTAGFLPLFWIYPFTVMLVMTVLWWVAWVEVTRNDPS